MKQIYSGFTWALGLVLLLAALIVLGSDPLPAMPLLAIALCTLPPSRRFFFSKLPRNLPPGAAAALVGVLFICFILTVSHVQSEKELAIESEKQAEIKRIFEKEFSVNKPAILETAREAFLKGDYKKAVELTAPYLSTKDEDLFQLNAKARNALFAIEAEEAQKKRAAEEHEAKIARQFNPWDGSHRALEKAIKETMNDPDSYKHVETKYGDHGDYLTLTTKVRGKNAFGGVITSTVRARVGIDGGDLRIYD